MRFELYVAARYLKAKRRQAVVGVVTAISITGVAAGVAALIIALAITNGMRRDLQERLIGSTAHVQLMQVAPHAIGDGQRDNQCGHAGSHAGDRNRRDHADHRLPPFGLQVARRKKELKSHRDYFAAPITVLARPMLSCRS